jgi:hypothetical protein
MALTIFLIKKFKSCSNFGLILIFIGHGFIRRSMFQEFKIIYKSRKSRKIFLNKSLNNYSNLFIFVFFFTLCLKSSLPLNLTFFSEIIIGITLYYFNKFSLFFFIISVFLIGLFNIKLFLILNQGKKLKSLNKMVFSLFPLVKSFLHIFIKFYIVFFFFRFFLMGRIFFFFFFCFFNRTPILIVSLFCISILISIFARLNLST